MICTDSKNVSSIDCVRDRIQKGDLPFALPEISSNKSGSLVPFSLSTFNLSHLPFPRYFLNIPGAAAGTPFLTRKLASYSTSLNANKNAAVITLCVTLGIIPPYNPLHPSSLKMRLKLENMFSDSPLLATCMRLLTVM